ncbi:MAG: hypothetical protein JW870_15365 [Candidatus Delongbacteria bacterium]|nr:hypothetical protein [Candidatus Delongbacteria bacterium]
MAKHTDKILTYLNKIRNKVKSMHYVEGDVRLEFYQYINSIIDSYFKGHSYLELLNDIHNKRLINPDELERKVHFFHLLDNNLIDEKRTAYYSDTTRRLILDSWTIFELTITTILLNLFPNEEIEKWLSEDYKVIMDLIADTALDDTAIKKISRLLKNNQVIKGHLTHYPVTRRIDKLFKKIRPKYPTNRDLEDDILYLRFLSKYRNSIIHFNTLYFGKKYEEYIFKGEKFIFRNSKLIIEPKKPMEFELVMELIDIFKVIEDCTKDIDTIKSIDND